MTGEGIIPLPVDHLDDSSPSNAYPEGMSVMPHTNEEGEITVTMRRIQWGGIDHATQYRQWSQVKRAWKAEDNCWTEWVPMDERFPS